MQIHFMNTWFWKRKTNILQLLHLELEILLDFQTWVKNSK